MNVKTAAFADIEDESFDNDTKLHKELLGKIPTVADPYIICPPTLRKLMHQYHPRGECQYIAYWSLLLDLFIMEMFVFISLEKPAPSKEAAAKSGSTAKVVAKPSSNSAKKVPTKSAKETAPEQGEDTNLLNSSTCMNILSNNKCLFLFADVPSKEVVCVAPSSPKAVQKTHLKDFRLEDFNMDILLKWTPYHKPQATLMNEYQDPHIKVLLANSITVHIFLFFILITTTSLFTRNSSKNGLVCILISVSI